MKAIAIVCCTTKKSDLPIPAETLFGIVWPGKKISADQNWSSGYPEENYSTLQNELNKIQTNGSTIIIVLDTSIYNFLTKRKIYTNAK